ncbi:hypothetical protein HG536_0A05350 [Torulaspora globosa]|uniref:Peptide hydrolase n=1 Tax=Torulaspora globosa TaxID=48254 RepID=A0A7G3ZB34_9SACH|nr:uncharacterized protein HG536_0A05350 [Torulaspora globosa]QLL30720.1 hypothetical protein HG536_0A05350 [Torulaspora globosa]
MKAYRFVATFSLTLQVSNAILFNDPLRVLEIGQDERIQVKESEKLSLKRRGVGFIDVTDHINLPWGKKIKNAAPVPDYDYPQTASQAGIVNKLITEIDQVAMRDDLAKFCSFFTRYYKSASGYESAQWLSSKLHNLTSELRSDVFEIEHFDHVKWKQFSIIFRVHGIETADNVVVIGSHQDSLNMIFPSLIPAPGADDDGSGTITSMEALRLYVKHLRNGHLPKNTVEFHFYSAEEGGLLGSMDVLGSYREQGRKVVAMVQQDMTGYVANKNDEHIGLVLDDANERLVDFLKVVIDAYVRIPYRETRCGYACSDHASATKNGFPSAFILESENAKTNRYIHTTMDTLDRLDFGHISEHVKISLATVIELSNWNFGK